MFTIDTDALERFTARQSDDEVKRDLELICDLCGELVCDIEHGDTLAVLARTASDHICDPGLEDDLRLIRKYNDDED